MHDCLQVQDIVDLIFTRVDQDSPARIGKQDLLSLALTCRDFQETALDILWHTQTNLVQLIKTLPRRSWTEEPDSGFDRTFKLDSDSLSEDDLARFFFYSRRIRQIRYLPYIWHLDAPYDFRALRALWKKRANKTIPLFLNLQRVEFVDIRHASPCLDIFLETKSISLSLYWSESDDDVWRLFDTIEEHALNMQELDLGALQVSTKTVICKHLSHLVLRMADLRGLCCGSRNLSIPALQHLASLPYLRTLQTANTPSDILHSLQSMPSKSFFPELHKLDMAVDDFSSFVDLVHMLRPMQLQDLTLHSAKTPSATQFHRAFTALKQASKNQSNFLRIVVKYSWPNIRQSPPILSDIIIDGSTLEPLLSFKNLTVIDLDMPFKIELGDTQLMAMADSWPNLQRLHLGALSGWHLPLLITFRGFMYLLHKCRQLEYLAFAFNASSDIPLLSEIPAACTNRNITYLFVGDSTVTESSRSHVAEFLGHILPNLSGIGGAWLYNQSDTFPPRHREWEWVVNSMKKSSRPEYLSIQPH
ncbi:hypothetical protein GALMADRAFT_77082 [Galerina marginata CBS 339.88]|uniref:F-box domain-containing protein n=1 Tax=Galerina marginata (strain CBS 339.88) TaxID=685588 RepID=A0A067SFV6_GALM3|nr:hypothetical protein GALMADRAFT_77082 [Galerina marginata CBS 339.88]